MIKTDRRAHVQVLSDGHLLCIAMQWPSTNHQNAARHSASSSSVLQLASDACLLSFVDRSLRYTVYYTVSDLSGPNKSMLYGKQKSCAFESNDNAFKFVKKVSVISLCLCLQTCRVLEACSLIDLLTSSPWVVTLSWYGELSGRIFRGNVWGLSRGIFWENYIV